MVFDLHFKSALVYELFNPYNSDSFNSMQTNYKGHCALTYKQKLDTSPECDCCKLLKKFLFYF